MAGDSEKNNIQKREITQEMQKSYLEYAMSVIVARALPDVRDGLKPVHRRILYCMNEMGLRPGAKYQKSAKVVGQVLGNYHPHGDAAAYESMVRMAQDFSLRYPLVDGQGNFGSVDGDPAAAYRYTEARLSSIAEPLLADIEKDTVNFRDNFDGSKQEPEVLPTRIPNLLINGSMGIAVGMATNIPPHNLTEVLDASMYLIDNKDADISDLMNFVKGPDFPTGGVIYNEQDVINAYATGRGPVVMRGVADIVESKKGFQVIISEIPYQVNKAELIIHIADLVKDKKLDGIRDIRDESDKEGLRIAIDLKQDAFPRKVLNQLYKYTELQKAFHFNMLGLVDGIQPQILGLKSLLEKFIEHRREVIVRRSKFELKKAQDRAHILEGLKKALDYIDEIIKIIRASDSKEDAFNNLIKKFKFSDKQATAILEMKLQALAGLERKKINDELKEKRELIAYLEDLLASPKKVMGVIKNELKEVKEKYGDERRTKVVKQGAEALSDEDLIPDEETVLVLTTGGYIKRTNPDEYKKQKRGGVGVVDLDTKEEDFVTTFLTATMHSDVLFFTDKGKAYQVKMYELPEGKRATRGKSIMNFLSIGAEEKVTSVLPMPKEAKKLNLSLLMITKNGVAKRVNAEAFHDVRRSGLLAITLQEGDELKIVSFTAPGDEAIIATSKGQSIRFKESDIRVMGRGAAGVRAIRLSKGDSVVGAGVIKKEAKTPAFLVISQNGYGKKTDLKEYKTQNRGGSGIRTMKVTAKTGNIIASKVITEEDQETVAISKKSQVIRVDSKEIPSLGRQTQGVRIMKLREGDSLVSLICL